MGDYTASAGLDLYLFEESYVLGFEVSDDRVALDLDAVLTEGHPRHEPPPPDEQFCYRRARLEFRSPSDVVFDESGAPPARDATGEIDFGSIDAFTIDEHRYHLEGSWGTLDVTAMGVDVTLHDPLSLPAAREQATRVLVGAVLDHIVVEFREQLREQLASLRVAGGPVTMLELTVDPAAPTAQAPDGPLDVRPTVTDATGAPVGELLLWITRGRLSTLEFAWWTDTPPDALPDHSALIFS